MKTLIRDIENHREEWLKLKSKTVGSSEVATICGLSSYSSPLKLWREKTGRDAPQLDNDHMWLGRKLEPVVAELFERKNEAKLYKPDAMYASASAEWATATPDYIWSDSNRDAQIVECKARSFGMARHYEDGGMMPSDHLQLNWQLGVLGLKSGYLAALCGNSPKDFYTPALEFSAEVFSQCMAKAEEFIHYVKTDKEPPAMALDKDVLNLITPDQNKTLNLPDEAGEALEVWDEARREVERLEELLDQPKARAETAKARLQQLMGDATKGFWGRYTVTNKRIERAAYECKASAYNRLSIKETKE